MTDKTPISKEVLEKIVELILKYKKPEKIVVFGSRATDNFKDTSDIDIAIFGKDWTDRDINLIRHILNQDIKTSLKFDVLNFYQIEKEKLKVNILKNGRTLYERREN
jgi:predicted nucleotidyltransferase